MKIHWFLPTGGDGRDVAPSGAGPGVRAPDLGYLAQVAQAADRLGFDGLLTPCGTMCEDAWLATAALIPLTERVKFLVAFRPGLLSPTLAAQMASTYQRLSGGRLLLNLVTGAEPSELARFGDFADKDTRYERTGEFIAVMRGAWAEGELDHDGRHYRVEGATTRRAPDPVPPMYFGGASPAAEQVAADQVDVYLAWGEPPAMVAERIERVRALAAEPGARCGSASASMSSPDPPPTRRGRSPTACWPAWNPPRSRPRRPTSRARSPRASGAWRRCTQTATAAWRSTRTCGPASGWCAAAPAPRSWAATTRWPTGSRSTTRSASTSSSCPATRTSRRPTGSARACCRSSAPGGLVAEPAGASVAAPVSTFR